MIFYQLYCEILGGRVLQYFSREVPSEMFNKAGEDLALFKVNLKFQLASTLQ